MLYIKLNRLLTVALAMTLMGHRAADSGTLLGSTFLGGSGKDGIMETQLTVDAEGNLFIAGRTTSADFPYIDGCYDPTYNDGIYDLFVAKFSPDLSTLLASTYLGGSLGDGQWPGVSLALDAQGNVFVAARTYSMELDYTYGNMGGVPDIYIVKMDNDLQDILSSRMLGGVSGECFVQLAIDSDGTLLVAGTTASSGTFPTTPGAFQTTYGGDGGGPYPGDVFVCRFTNDLSSMLASTLLGGGNNEYCEALLVAADGTVYLGGWTASANFPRTVGPYYRGGMYDAFVSRLSGDLTSLVASTFLGGSGWDFVYGMTLGADGSVIVTGHTASANFPTTLGAFDRTYGGSDPPNPGTDDDAFVSKFDASLATLLASTFIGGVGWENGLYLHELGAGDILLAGHTRSSTFPSFQGSYDPSFNGTEDIFVARLAGGLDGLLVSTFLGGNLHDLPCGLHVDASGNVYVSGITNSADYPTLPESYDPSFNGAGGSWSYNNGDSYGGDVTLSILPQYYFVDVDQDGLIGDNCPNTYNPDQADADGDGIGDACDCCIGRVGDANGYGGDEPTISDISTLIDAKFINGICGGIIFCLAEGDVNQSGGTDPTCDDVTISDISTLIDYLFITGPETAMLLDCL